MVMVTMEGNKKVRVSTMEDLLESTVVPKAFTAKDLVLEITTEVQPVKIQLTVVLKVITEGLLVKVLVMVVLKVITEELTVKVLLMVVLKTVTEDLLVKVLLMVVPEDLVVKVLLMVVPRIVTEDLQVKVLLMVVPEDLVVKVLLMVVPRIVIEDLVVKVLLPVVQKVIIEDLTVKVPVTMTLLPSSTVKVVTDLVITVVPLAIMEIFSTVGHLRVKGRVLITTSTTKTSTKALSDQDLKFTVVPVISTIMGNLGCTAVTLMGRIV
jgi:hypothetical protein